MSGTEITEKSFEGAAKSLAQGKLKGGAIALVGVLSASATASPILGGLTVGALHKISELLCDSAMARAEKAGRQYDDERLREKAFQELLIASVRPMFEEQSDQANEQFLQMLQFMRKNVASAEGQAQNTGLLQEVLEVLLHLEGSHTQRPAVPVFEGPGAAPAKALLQFSAGKELEELEQALKKSETVCVVAAGMGGVGKSTLANQLVATRGRELFPDGVGWLNANNLAGDIERVARVFGWTDFQGRSIEEGRDWLQDNLSSRKVLLVVDNVDPKTILLENIPLLGGTEARVLLTSREIRLGEELRVAGQTLNLEHWSQGRCRVYLRGTGRFSRATDAELEELGEFVGGLALALPLLAQHPAYIRGQSVATLLSKLKATPTATLDKYAAKKGKDDFFALRGVVATFAGIFEEEETEGGLSAFARRTLESLSVCAQGTTPEIVAAIAGQSEEETEIALNQLADSSLVQHVDSSEAPWALHDVLRDFVRCRQSVEELEEKHAQWLDGYMTEHQDPSAHKEFARCVPEGLSRVYWLCEDGQAKQASEMFFPLYVHLQRVGQFAQILGVGHRVLDCQLEGTASRAMWLGNLGLVYQTRGKLDRAVEFFDKALAINTELGSKEGMANQYGNLGIVYETRGNLDQAIESWEKSLTLFRQVGETPQVEQVQGWLNAAKEQPAATARPSSQKV